jgi:uncharacterized protein (DUF305 family)
MLRLAIPLAGALAVLPLAAGAASHGHAMPSAHDSGPATAAYQAALAKMHSDMAIEYTGDADRDFVRGMIPHHQGAIDMAKVVLEHGSDPEIRRLAEEIVAAQEREIAFMREWLERKGN